MTLDTSSTSQKLSALVHVLNQITNRGAQFVMYASSLGAIALVAKSDMPVEFLSAGIGVNLMSSVIEKVARNRDGFSSREIENAVEEAILASNLDKLLTEDKHLRVVAKLMRQQDKIFFATKSSEFELKRLSTLVDKLVQNSSEPSSLNSLNITHFFALSEKSDFVEDTRSRVRNLWQRAELLEKVYFNSAASELYREARDLVKAALERDCSTSDFVQLQILLSKAKQLYDDFRQRHEMPTSIGYGGGIVSLILIFSEWFENNPDTLVSYYSNETPYSDVKVMTVSAALEVARSHLRSFWQNKISEYLDSARSYLNEHRPREAMTALDRCDVIPGRHDNRLGIVFPDFLEVQIDRARANLKPELEALKIAERKVQLARLEPDSYKARILMDEARKDYPFLPELQQLDQDLGYYNSDQSSDNPQ